MGPHGPQTLRNQQLFGQKQSPRPLWNPEINQHIHDDLPLAPALGRVRPCHLFMIRFNIIRTFMSMFIKCCLSITFSKICISCILATCPTQLNLLDCIFQIIFGKEYIAHKTAICRNLPIHSFTGGRRNLTDPQQTNTKHVMSLRNYKEKQFVCGQNIWTEGAFVMRESQSDELCGLRQTAVS